MSDPYEELYDTKREACETGQYLGAADAVRRVRARLSVLSVKYEKQGDLEKFHALEEACGEARKVAEMIEYDRERAALGGNQS